MQEAFYGKEVIVADREMVESRIEVILDGADKEDVAFMVVGDPFGCAATTITVEALINLQFRLPHTAPSCSPASASACAH